jgi:tetratricopeptide (TPR) repeat protein
MYMRFIKHLFTQVIIIGMVFKSFAQVQPPVQTGVLPPDQPNLPQHGRPMPPRHDINMLSPDSIMKAYGDSAHARMAAGDYQGAFKYCDYRIKKTPFRMQFMYYDRAQAETYLGKVDNAIRDYDTVIMLDSSSAAFMNQAYLYMQTHKTDKAMYDYGKALKNTKDSTLLADIYLSRGNAYLTLKQTKEAGDDFTQALTYNPHSWQSWLQRGSIYRFAKDYKNALIDLNEAYRLKPTDADILLLRGVIMYESGMFKESIAALKESAKVRKNNDTWYYLGMAEMNTGHDSLARDYLTKLLETDSKNVLVLNTRGKINFEMKHPLLAIKDYTKVIELKPKGAEGYANRAYVYSSIGDRDKACADLHKAASLGLTKANEAIKKYCGK